MSYNAIVYRILIASPNDVKKERQAIPEVIGMWNATHSIYHKVVLLPVMWETHSTPAMGDRPQAIINKQLVQSCDILVGAFWTRIGTHTGVAESGTVEEIEEFRQSGKPILLYFSSAPVALESVDQEQYKRLVEFKKECQQHGLTENYESISGLREKLLRHINGVVREIHGEPDLVPMHVDETIEEKQRMWALFRSILNRAELDWATERGIEPAGLDKAKYTLQALVSDLIDFRSGLGDRVDRDLLKEFDHQISELKRLDNHQIFLDGGVSYRKFWTKGDQIFKSLHELPSKFVINAKHTKNQLEKEKTRILQTLAKIEAQGRDSLEDAELADLVNLSITLIRHHIFELENEGYIQGSHAMGSPPEYSLDSKGRKYVIENKLL